MNDRITVIIPVYNVEPYLARCVDSVLAQTYTDLEIFLVDDGSTDNCRRICDEYAERDSRIQVIHKTNGGLSDARNAALDVCTGEYISFVDSDDYVSDDFIESLYCTARKFGTRIAVCGIVRFDESGELVTDYAPSDVEKCVSGREMFETVWRPSACNKLYHRSIFAEIRYPYGKLYEDLFIYHDILAEAGSLSFTGKNSYYYFYRQGSIIHRRFDIRNLDLVEGLDLRINKLRELRLDELADRQLPFMIGQTIEAFRQLRPAADPETAAKLKNAKRICDRHYREMMSYRGFTRAQKGKIALFRWLPRVYAAVFGGGI